MKKIICALLILIMLCSCSSSKNIRVVNRNLEYNAHIFYFGKEYKMHCSINETLAEYRVVEGQIKGFGAKVDENGIKVCYANLEKEIKGESNSVFSVMYDITLFFDTEGYKTENDGGNYYVDGQTDFGKFRYILSPSGLPISINFENGDFSADFYDVNLKKVE